MTFSEDEIRDLVRQVLLRTLGPDGVVPAPGGEAPPAATRTIRPTITEADVLRLPRGSTLEVPSEAVVTPLARDTARERGVQLVSQPGSTPEPALTAGAATGRAVALGADHGATRSWIVARTAPSRWTIPISPTPSPNWSPRAVPGGGS